MEGIYSWHECEIRKENEALKVQLAEQTKISVECHKKIPPLARFRLRLQGVFFTWG